VLWCRLGGEFPLGVTYEHRADGCDLSNLRDTRTSAGSTRHCEAEGGRRKRCQNNQWRRRKVETYCEFADLSDQIDEATHNQDIEQAKELSKKVDELGRKLGPEFVALAGALKNMDPNSQDGHEIGPIFDKLDNLCED